uniref:Proteoglycan 4 n=1 Tax=Pogona vitticeps TaxID=103695 RepID=A0ABM5G991_9SAUR
MTDPGDTTNPDESDKPKETITVTEFTVTEPVVDDVTSSNGIDKSDKPDQTITTTETTPIQIDPRGVTPSPRDDDTNDKTEQTTTVTETIITETEPMRDSPTPDNDKNNKSEETVKVTETITTQTDPNGMTPSPFGEGSNERSEVITTITETIITETYPQSTTPSPSVDDRPDSPAPDDDKNSKPEKTTTTIETTTASGTPRPEVMTTVTETVTTETNPKGDEHSPGVDDKNGMPEVTTVTETVITEVGSVGPDKNVPSENNPEISAKTTPQPEPASDEPNPSDDGNGDKPNETTKVIETTTIITQPSSPNDYTPSPDQSDKPDSSAKVTQTTTTITTESKPLSDSPNPDESGSVTTVTKTTQTTTTESNPNPSDNNENPKSEVITKITRIITTTTTTTTTQSNTTEYPETTTRDVTTNTKIDLVSDRVPTKESPSNKNTNTTVTQVTTTSSISSTSPSNPPSIGDKTTQHTTTSPITRVPTKRRQVVTYYPTTTYSTISTTRLPEKITNKTTEYVRPENIVTSLLYKDTPDEMNLCNRKPADGIVPLRNGSLAVFRGHYYWLLNGTHSPSPCPRKIVEVWGIPSPIDTVFSRCNCDGKTFFFKDSQYWRFTDDIMDPGYPKLIVKGFGGLNGKITGALSVARHRNRPESVYFFKKGGNLQQYTYKQEGPKKCRKKVVTVKYPAYKPKAIIRRKRRRFERAVRPHQVFRSVRVQRYPVIQIRHQPIGVLQPEVKVSSYWRGFPKEVNSVISIPNNEKSDGYDYYAFSKDQYYSVDVGSRIARPVTLQTGQTVSGAWYKCPSE